ncbi:11371_t:CDS:2, partial [Funneliformis mosseae]
DQLSTNEGSEVHCERPPARVITKKKRSIIGKQYYEEFSIEFWKEPDICFSDIRIYFGSQRSTTLSNTTIQSTLSTSGPLETGSDTSFSSHK